MTLPRALLAKALGNDSRVIAAFEQQAQKVDDTADSVEATATATEALQDASFITLAPNATLTAERVLVLGSGLQKHDGGDTLTLLVDDEVAHVAGGHPAYLTAQGPTSLVLPLSGTLTTRQEVAAIFANLSDYANDAAAAVGGIAVGSLYRTGSAVMVRVA